MIVGWRLWICGYMFHLCSMLLLITYFFYSFGSSRLFPGRYWRGFGMCCRAIKLDFWTKHGAMVNILGDYWNVIRFVCDVHGVWAWLVDSVCGLFVSESLFLGMFCCNVLASLRSENMGGVHVWNSGTLSQAGGTVLGAIFWVLVIRSTNYNRLQYWSGVTGQLQFANDLPDSPPLFDCHRTFPINR
jgi:hypothetical protein